MKFRDLGMGVMEIIPHKIVDARGYFSEVWHLSDVIYARMGCVWVQESQSYSHEKYVLRGLHLQTEPTQQAKLVRVLKGSVFDVAVDARPNSTSFGNWVSCILSAESFNQLYIPEGFAHGFLTLEPGVEVLYKVSSPYAPNCERNIKWNDESIGIKWPLPPGINPILSIKDERAMTWKSFVLNNNS